MGLIIQSARLALCKCGQHGVVAFGDGSKSMEFVTKNGALAEVEMALLAKKIILAEAEFLRQEIEQSAILTEEGLGALLKKAVVVGYFKSNEQEYMHLPAVPGSTLH